MSRIKNLFMQAKQHPILSLILLLQVLVIVYINLFRLQYYIGYDCSAYYLQTIEMWRQKTLLPNDWSFQTTLCWDSPAILAMLFYGLTGNIFLSYGISNLIVVLLLVLCLNAILNRLDLSLGSKMVFFILFFTPFYMNNNSANNLDYFNMMFSSMSAYSVKVFIILFICLIFWRFYVEKDSSTIIFYAFFCIILCVISGISSGIYILIFAIAPIFFFYIVQFFIENEYYKKSLIAFLFLLLCSFAVLFGKLLQSVVDFASKDSMAIWTNLEIFWNNIGSIFTGFYKLLGALPVSDSVNILSFVGISYAFRLGLATVILIVGIYNIVCVLRKRVINLEAFLVWIIVTHFLIFTFCYTTYGGTIFEARYLIPIFILLTILFAKWIDKIIFGSDNRNIKFIFSCGIFICIIAVNLYSWYCLEHSKNPYNVYESIIEQVGKINTPVVYLGGADMGITGRNLRVLDNSRVYKLSEDMKGAHHWGDYTYYDENYEYEGPTTLICSDSFYDELPLYLKEQYSNVNKIMDTNINIYYSEYNPIDFRVGISDNKFNRDFLYTAGICVCDGGEFDESGAFVIDNFEGFVFWGPYVPAPTGKYNFTLNYEVLSDIKERQVVGEFDIALDSISFKKINIESNKNSVTINNLELTYNELGKLLEYRAYIYDGVKIKLKSIEIERVD